MPRQLPTQQEQLSDTGGKTRQSWYAWFDEINTRLKGILSDAPVDGTQYARKDAAWTAIQIPSPTPPTLPAEPTFAVQYNGGTSFGGSASFTYNGSQLSLIGSTGNLTTATAYIQRDAGLAMQLLKPNSIPADNAPFMRIRAPNVTGLLVEAGQPTPGGAVPFQPAVIFSDWNSGQQNWKFWSNASSSLQTATGLRLFKDSPDNLLFGVNTGTVFSPSLVFCVCNNNYLGNGFIGLGRATKIKRGFVDEADSLASSVSLQVEDGQAFLRGSSTLAPLNLEPRASVPASLANGDVWTDASGLYVRIGGVTYNLVSGGAAAGSNTQVQFNNGGSLAGASGLTWTSGTSTTATVNLTTSGLMLTAASAAGGSGFRMPHGSAPTSPVDGDLWTTTAGIFARVNGATIGPLGAVTAAGSNTQIQYNNAGAFAGAANLTWNNGTSTLAATNVSATTLTATGLTLTAATAAGGAGFRLPHGTTPTTPTNGDVWTTTGGMFVYINGTTIGPLGSGGSSPGGATTNVQFNNAGAFNGSPKFTWTDSTGVLYVNNGSSASALASGIQIEGNTGVGNATSYIDLRAQGSLRGNVAINTVNASRLELNSAVSNDVSIASGGGAVIIAANSAPTTGTKLDVRGTATILNKVNIGSNTNPNFALQIFASESGNDLVYLRNTSTIGFSGLQLQSSASAFMGAFGYGNSSVSDTDLRDRVYHIFGTNNYLIKSNGAIRMMLFSTNGNFRFGSSTTDPGVPFQVDGTAVFASTNPIRTGSATMIQSTVAFTNGAAASVGTLTNAPAAGNPTKWIPINDNGTTRYIPAW